MVQPIPSAASYLRWSFQWLMQEGGGDPAADPSLRSISNLQPAGATGWWDRLLFLSPLQFFCRHVAVMWECHNQFSEIWENTFWSITPLVCLGLIKKKKKHFGICEYVPGCKLSHSITGATLFSASFTSSCKWRTFFLSTWIGCSDLHSLCSLTLYSSVTHWLQHIDYFKSTIIYLLHLIIVCNCQCQSWQHLKSMTVILSLLRCSNYADKPRKVISRSTFKLLSNRELQLTSFREHT